MPSVKEYISGVLSDKDSALWALALVSISVLVGVGRIDQKLLEYMIMAIIGRAAVGQKKDPKSDA